MKLPLFGRNRQADTIEALYGMIVAQARSPSFYRDYGVPDTVNGRFDMIVLHLALVLNRLESVPEQVLSLGQGLFDRFCRDMDDNLREMGISDLKVPKEMQQMAAAFYGRAAAYRSALAGGDEAALVAALGRNVFGESHPGARRLAAYMRIASESLQRQESVPAGDLQWPSPELISVPEQP
jgi:cytochrome b pre-mRNA-processing protein 3